MCGLRTGVGCGALEVLRPPRGQQRMLLPPEHRPVCVAMPWHVKPFVSMHSPERMKTDARDTRFINLTPNTTYGGMIQIKVLRHWSLHPEEGGGARDTKGYY